MKIVLISFLLVATLVQGSFQKNVVYTLSHSVDHGAGLVWDPRTDILYFTNVINGTIYAFHWRNTEFTSIQLNGTVTPIIPSKKDPNLFLVGLNRSVVALEWNAVNSTNITKQTILTTVSDDFPTSRFNAGKADSKGRLWWGTTSIEKGDKMPLNQGHLYEITKDNLKNPKIVKRTVSDSNGLTWNMANDKLYYIDTVTRKVVEFDYNAESGTISEQNRTVFDVANFPKNITGYPTGMTMDDEDKLWIALYGGGAVIRVDPKTGELMTVIRLLARDVTSLVWGGPSYDILFVATSKISLTPEEREKYRLAGCVFAIMDVYVRGFKTYLADIVDSV